MSLTPKIHAIGTAVPPNRISQMAHSAILANANGLSRQDKLVLHTIYKRSGIDYRYSVLAEFGMEDKAENQIFHPAGMVEAAQVAERMVIYETHAAQLCEQAINNCFAKLTNFESKQITHVITFSCTGMYAPGLDIQLVEKLDLHKDVERTCINFMGCYAAINALKSANHICRSQPDAVVLLAGVELCTLHFIKSSDSNQVVANALFGDGAAAVLVSSLDLKKKETQSTKLLLKAFHSEFEQSASSAMVWRIGNQAFDLRLTPEVPNVVKDNIGPMMEKLYNKAGVERREIKHFAIHPGGIKILEACEQAMDIAKEENENSYEVLRDFGNMSSVTVLFVLEKHMLQLSEKDKGSALLSCAFGPGITMEAMMLEVA